MAKGKRPENIACQKNDILTLEIVDMGNEGEGVARKEGYTLFVKDALPGDVIRGKVMKTRKHFGYVRLLEILQPSPCRVESECSVARQCGGCQLQHCSYEKQLEWKQEKIANCLRRIGGQAVITPEEAAKSREGLSAGGVLKSSEEAPVDMGELKVGSDSARKEETVVMEPIMGMVQP